MAHLHHHSSYIEASVKGTACPLFYSILWWKLWTCWLRRVCTIVWWYFFERKWCDHITPLICRLYDHFLPTQCRSTLEHKKALVSFNLASEKRVNFHKSALLWINFDHASISNTTMALLCCVGSFPITYLGLPIGGIKSRVDTWEPIIHWMQKKLAT